MARLPDLQKQHAGWKRGLELQRTLHIQRARLACVDAFVVVVIRAGEIRFGRRYFSRRTPGSGLPILRTKVIGYACAPEHKARGCDRYCRQRSLLTVLALSANWLDWKSLFRIERPVARFIVHAQRAFVFWGEGHLIAIGVAFLADLSVHIRIACVDRNVVERWRQCAETIAESEFPVRYDAFYRVQ